MEKNADKTEGFEGSGSLENGTVRGVSRKLFVVLIILLVILVRSNANRIE